MTSVVYWGWRTASDFQGLTNRNAVTAKVDTCAYQKELKESSENWYIELVVETSSWEDAALSSMIGGSQLLQQAVYRRTDDVDVLKRCIFTGVCSLRSVGAFISGLQSNMEPLPRIVHAGTTRQPDTGCLPQLLALVSLRSCICVAAGRTGAHAFIGL